MDILMYVLFILCLPPSITLCTNQLSEPTLIHTSKVLQPRFQVAGQDFFVSNGGTLLFLRSPHLVGSILPRKEDST